MKKASIILILLLATSQALGFGGGYTSFIDHNDNEFILFGGPGIPRFECKHVFRHSETDGLVSKTYAYATSAFGYCPGYHSYEYTSAYQASFCYPKPLGSDCEKIPNHNPNSPQCWDDQGDLGGHGF